MFELYSRDMKVISPDQRFRSWCCVGDISFILGKALLNVRSCDKRILPHDFILSIAVKQMVRRNAAHAEKRNHQEYGMTKRSA